MDDIHEMVLVVVFRHVGHFFRTGGATEELYDFPAIDSSKELLWDRAVVHGCFGSGSVRKRERALLSCKMDGFVRISRELDLRRVGSIRIEQGRILEVHFSFGRGDGSRSDVHVDLIQPTNEVIRSNAEEIMLV